MSFSAVASDLLKNFGGVMENNLNSVLKIDPDCDDPIETYSHSDYYDLDSLVKLLKKDELKFYTLSLNIESLKAKFNQLCIFLEGLNNKQCQIDAFLLQETWLTDRQCGGDSLARYDIPGYQAISLGRKCGRKGGLMIYLRDCYTFSIRDLYRTSTHWEGLFIDVSHKHNVQLPNKISIANVYRPPRSNNSNISIDNFLAPFSEAFNTLTGENSTLITGGDFNINLLQINEREKYQEYFDLFVSNGSIPQITMPTRFAKKSATLIDQIFCRFSKFTSPLTSGIIATKLSDHLPCFSTINLNKNIHQSTKYINIRKKGPDEIQQFCTEIKCRLSSAIFDDNLFADPNTNFS